MSAQSRLYPVRAAAGPVNPLEIFGQASDFTGETPTGKALFGQFELSGFLATAGVQDDYAKDEFVSRTGMVGQAKQEFMATKVVRRSETTGDIDILPDMRGVSLDPLSTYSDVAPEGDETYEPPVPCECCGLIPLDKARPKLKEYSLSAVFFDPDVATKLRLSDRKYEQVKRLAMQDPSRAARLLEAHVLTTTGIPCKITAGEYAKSLKQARSTIKRQLSLIPRKDSSPPVYVDGDQVRVEYDDYGEIPPEDRPWRVVGPVAHFQEVLAMYHLALHYGPAEAVFMLPLETIRLKIDIEDMVNDEFFTGALSGYVDVDGLTPVNGEMPANINTDQASRLYQAKRYVRPIECRGRVVGSCVRLSDTHLAVNAHALNVLCESDLVGTVDGVALPRQAPQVSPDVVLIASKGKGPSWAPRIARVDERIVVCYASVDDTHEYSEVLSVKSVQQGMFTCTSSKRLRKGCSGGMAIALSDGAILGMLVSVQAQGTVCAMYTSALRETMVVDADAWSDSSVDVGARSPGEQTFSLVKKRGLLPNLAPLAESTACLVSETGESLATCTQVIDGAITAGVRSNEVLLNGDFVDVHFSDGIQKFSSSRAIGAPVVDTRAPVVGEEVFAFAKDVDDVVIMTSVETVLSASPGGFCVAFATTNLNLLGALVISACDCKVLGVVVGHDVDTFGDDVIRAAPFKPPPLDPISFTNMSFPSVLSERCSSDPAMRDAVSDVMGVSTELSFSDWLSATEQALSNAISDRRVDLVVKLFHLL